MNTFFAQTGFTAVAGISRARVDAVEAVPRAVAVNFRQQGVNAPYSLSGSERITLRAFTPTKPLRTVVWSSPAPGEDWAQGRLVLLFDELATEQAGSYTFFLTRTVAGVEDVLLYGQLEVLQGHKPAQRVIRSAVPARARLRGKARASATITGTISLEAQLPGTFWEGDSIGGTVQLTVNLPGTLRASLRLTGTVQGAVVVGGQLTC